MNKITYDYPQNCGSWHSVDRRQIAFDPETIITKMVIV